MRREKIWNMLRANGDDYRRTKSYLQQFQSFLKKKTPKKNIQPIRRLHLILAPVEFAPAIHPIDLWPETRKQQEKSAWLFKMIGKPPPGLQASPVPPKFPHPVHILFAQCCFLLNSLWNFLLAASANPVCLQANHSQSNETYPMSSPNVPASSIHSTALLLR